MWIACTQVEAVIDIVSHRTTRKSPERNKHANSLIQSGEARLCTQLTILNEIYGKVLQMP